MKTSIYSRMMKEYLLTTLVLIYFLLSSSFTHPRNGVIRSFALHALKKKKPVPLTPEFSRIINVAQISPRKTVQCKLLAKESERKSLSERFDVEGINYFAANVTLARQDIQSILVTGTISAVISNGELFPEDYINSEFDTILLDNSNVPIGERLNIDDATDYDEEVGPTGDIDVGEIAAQYLSLEIY
jgi:hypothetical protein